MIFPKRESNPAVLEKLVERIKMTDPTSAGSSKERLTEIRSSAEVGKANGITAERRYGGDAYADRVWLVTEVDRLQDRCAEFEANLTIAERQVTEARMELDRRSDETFVQPALERVESGPPELAYRLPLKANGDQSDGSRTISEPASDYNRTEPPSCTNVPALIAHNNAAVQLAHDRLIRINELEAALKAKESNS